MDDVESKIISTRLNTQRREKIKLHETGAQAVVAGSSIVVTKMALEKH